MRLASTGHTGGSPASPSFCAKPIGHGVGVARELEPKVIGQIGGKLRGQEAVLGKKLAGAFAPLAKKPGAFGCRR